MYIPEEQAPREEVLRVAQLINQEHLLSIDQISITREQLLQRYYEKYKVSLDATAFGKVLDELEAIEVALVEDGEETGPQFYS